MILTTRIAFAEEVWGLRSWFAHRLIRKCPNVRETLQQFLPFEFKPRPSKSDQLKINPLTGRVNIYAGISPKKQKNQGVCEKSQLHGNTVFNNFSKIFFEDGDFFVDLKSNVLIVLQSYLLPYYSVYFYFCQYKPSHLLTFTNIWLARQFVHLTNKGF